MGKGNTKNRRGGGRRGGRGRAGSHKHKFPTYWMTFGIKQRLKPKTERGEVLTIEQFSRKLPQWLEEKKVAMQGKHVVVDGKAVGLKKLLSQGTISTAVQLKNIQLSEKAKQKIEQAGGTAAELN